MSIGSFKRRSHRCEIAIALYQEFCGNGIGKRMMQTALDVAVELIRRDKRMFIEGCEKNNLEYVLIDEDYETAIRKVMEL